jgi:transcriptional regulator with XRE-family HTH domain
MTKPVRRRIARTKETDRIDRHVGGRLRTLRRMRGLSQAQLAAMLEMTFQQVQKYEKATNRISASRLVQLSQVLDAPITWFFEGIDQPETLELPNGAHKIVEAWAKLTQENRRNVLNIINAINAGQSRSGLP